MESSPSTALSPNSYYSSFDFLSLVGLDSHNTPTDLESPAAASGSKPSAISGGDHQHTHNYHSDGAHVPSPDEPLDDPSPIALDIPSRSTSGHGSRRSNTSVTQAPSQKGTRRASRSSINSARQYPAASPMEVDHNAVQGSGRNTPAVEGHDLMNMEVSGAAYDAIQAGILQHQLESIHMHSPFINAAHPTSPYNAMAQMFLTSPPGHPGSLTENQQDRPSLHRKYSAANVAGVLTPGPSGEIHPEMRMDLMSPMQLEMLARGEMIEGLENFHPVPLLSPALSQSASAYNSPVAHVAFNSNKDANQHALQQLQVQQRQFQEQLALLQEQQKQLQATAAAVAAASGSPFLSPQQQRMNNGPHSAGHVSTPSPGSYFSPLTSPALEPAVNRSQAFRAAAAHFSPAMHSQQHQHQRPAHPLSALSSPALNPVGSSGGAQQTLSPALVAQTAGDDADYINALQGILDNSSGPSDPGYQGSPVMGPTGPGNSIMSPVMNGTTGPHRGSLNAKSRPSPMMKPTNHRSHGRSSSSVPSSPMAFKVPGSGFLPPAAIDQRGVQQQQQQQQQALHSTNSTPSPVDLAQIMPPPPVPTQNSRPTMPMTPASLMNLGKSEAEAESSKAVAEAAPPPPRAAAKKAATAIAPALQPASKRGSRLVPSGGAAAAKRALAIRPPGGVGVRAATKGAAAAAAAAANNVEPETRRTSHKAAEQKRRDSLKAGFDELRLLLPPINTEALDPESGEPIPGSSAPRLLPKSSLVPDDNPNRGVSKVALLKFSNEYIVRLHNKVEKRDGYIDKLREEIRRLRGDDPLGIAEVRGDEGEDLLEMDMLDGEEDDLGGSSEDEDEMDVDQTITLPTRKKANVGKSPALGPTRRPSAKASAGKRRANE